jgi:hypothetical protein
MMVSNSRILENGTGFLAIGTNGGEISLRGDSFNDYMLKAEQNSAVTLYHNALPKLATTSTGIDVTGVITTDGMTTSADINFGDSDKAVFGAGSDLQIYHDGSNSYIRDIGTGNLNILADELKIMNASGTENKAFFVSDGGAYLYHNNSSKLETTATGIDVTGTVSADALTVDASTSQMITLNHSTPSNLTTLGQDSSGDFRVRSDNVNKLKSYANGDFELYEDTGTTAKFFWDASAESLGIGTSSPSALLQLEGADGVPQLKFLRTGTNIGGIIRQSSDPYGLIYDAIDGNAGAPTHVFRTSTDGSTFTERMRIDASGNVGIGSATANNFSTAGTTNVLGVKSTSGGLISIAATGTNFSGVDLGTDSIRRGGVYSLDGSNLAFYTNATNSGTALTERMRIDSSGLVAIGTSSPVSTAQLTVGGTSRIAPVSGNGLLLASGGSDRMFISTAGNVGIGTSSPNIANFTKALTILDSSASNQIPAIELAFGSNTRGANIAVDNRASVKALAITAVASDLAMTFGTNNTERMRIDSAGNVGIGNSNPSAFNSLGATDKLVIGDSAVSNLTLFGTSYGSLAFADSNTSSSTAQYAGLIQYYHADNSMQFLTNSTEAMRIDSIGRLLIGKTVADSIGTDGIELDGANDRVLITRSDSEPLVLNRKTSDGDIAIFRKDGTAVGSIGVIASDNLYIAGNAGSTKGVYFNNTSMLPCSSGGTLVDNTVDIGKSDYRYKDLYLSGGVYLGGTGSANKLDDYEEGDHTTSITCSTSGTVTLNTTFDSVSYVKVGQLVTVICNCWFSVGNFKISMFCCCKLLLQTAAAITS